MDLIDKRILLAFSANCRVSYQLLAKKLGLTVNAIKKRVRKLIEQEIIREFYCYLSLAISGGETLLATLTTEGGKTDPKLLDKLGANPMVYAGSYLSDGRILLYAEYKGAEKLDELGRFLRGTEGITQVDMHTILYDKGSACEFTRSDLKVLRVLQNDARMPIAKISEQTGLTPRRIRKILRKFLGESGPKSETYVPLGDIYISNQCVHFSVTWDLNAGGATAFILRVDWDPEKGTRNELLEWIEKQFPEEFWYFLISATKPTLFCIFVLEHMRDAQEIVQKTLKGPAVQAAETYFGYPTKHYPSPRDLLLEQMFAEHDL